jgi:hypothetical protein
MNFAAFATTLIFAVASFMASVGVPINLAASDAARAGARIAPAKDNSQSPGSGKRGAQGEGIAK